MRQLFIIFSYGASKTFISCFFNYYYYSFFFKEVLHRYRSRVFLYVYHPKSLFYLGKEKRDRASKTINFKLSCEILSQLRGII